MTIAVLFRFLNICSFSALCDAAAQDYVLGDVDMIDAVDRLQDHALAHSIVSELGQDTVQSIIATAFARVRRDDDRRQTDKAHVAAATFDAAAYLIRKNDQKRLAAWLARHTAQERAEIRKHFEGRNADVA